MIQTTASNKKVRELLKAVRDGSLIPRPEFQRRLVWTSKDKDRFIETVLNGYPFPEIYLCNGDVDTETGEGTQLLVDGLQRVNTLFEYFTGEASFANYLTPPYRVLQQHEKENFLEYNVVVRDLGQLSKDQIIEVFRRLNSTQYTLRVMEINNAIYNGEMKRFCEQLAEHEFFTNHNLFSATDRRRMGDVSYCLTMIGTLILGYFNRDDEHEGLLKQYNESFPLEQEIGERTSNVLAFIDECGFFSSSRIWKKADFFTAFVEIDTLLQGGRVLAPSVVVSNLEAFYQKVEFDRDRRGSGGVANLYYRAALQASNDKLNRIRRGAIVLGTILGHEDDQILQSLHELGVL